MAHVLVNYTDFASIHKQNIPKSLEGKTSIHNIKKSTRSLQNNKHLQPWIKLIKSNPVVNKKTIKKRAIQRKQKFKVKMKFPKSRRSNPPKKDAISKTHYQPLEVSLEPTIEYDIDIDELLLSDSNETDPTIHPDLAELGKAQPNTKKDHQEVDKTTCTTPPPACREDEVDITTWMTPVAYREEQDRLAIEKGNWSIILAHREEHDHRYVKNTHMTTDRVSNVPDDYSGGLSSPDEDMSGRGSSLTSWAQEAEDLEEKFSHSMLFEATHNPI